MNAHTQVFRNNLATAGTLLRRASGVDEYNRAPGAFSLVRAKLHKSSPGHVRDIPVNDTVPVGLHVLNVQILKRDQPKAVDQFATLLMCKVVATIVRPPVSVTQRANDLAAFGAALRQLFLLALKASNVLRVTLHPALAFDRVAGGQHGKGFQAQIDTGHLARHRQRTWFNLARETGVPVAHAIPTKGQRLLRACHRAMQFDLHVTYLGDAQPPVVEEAPVAFWLRIREAVVPTLPLEAWVTRLLTCLDAAKEGAKGQIDTLLRVLHSLCVAFIQPAAFLFPACKQKVRIIAPQTALFVLPRIAAYFQRLVVHPSAQVKLALKGGALRFRRVQAVFERHSHRTSVSRVATQCKSLCSIGGIHHSPKGERPLPLFCRMSMR